MTDTSDFESPVRDSVAKQTNMATIGAEIAAARLGEVFAETGGAPKQIALIIASMMVVGTGTGLRD